MSSSALKKQARSLLADIQKTANKEVKSTRKQLEKQHGQILIINKKRFMTNLTQLIPQLKNNQSIKDEIWQRFSIALKSREARVNPKRLAELKTCKIIGLKATDNIFYVATYGTARRAKSSTLRRIIRIVFSQRKKQLTDEEQTNLSKIGGSDNKFGAQLGHAESVRGSTVGFAASSLRVAAAKEALNNFSGSTEEKGQLLKGFSEYEKRLKIDFTHVQHVTATGITKEYIPIISWQDAISNQELAQAEAAALRNLQSYLTTVATNEGSTPLDDALGQVFLYDTASAVKKTKKKVTGKSKKQIKESSKATVKGKTKSKNAVNIVRDSGISKSVVPKTGKSRGANSLATLLGVLNQKLPETVAKNMGDPALNYQTGRFAGSVRVTDIVKTPQGFPSIGYTYMKSPYQTFEPGYQQGYPPERDPRKLIDRSIREIAAQFAIGRFYTRRE